MTKQHITKVSCISLLFLAMLSVSFLYATHRTMTAKAACPSCCGKWRVVKSPNPGTIHNGFNSVAAISANDVWAVGSEGNQGSTQTLIEHWNGSTWSVVKSPNPSATANSLSGVAAISSSNVWAVGNSYDSHVSKYQTLVEH
jgi:hypothetical protein